VVVGHAPHEVSVSPDGRHAVVSNYGTREAPGSTLSILDLEQPRELRRIELAPHQRPHGVAWFAHDRIAVTTEASKSLLVVEPSTGRVVAAIDTGQEVSHMVAVAADGQRAYVANIGSGTTTALDLAMGRKLHDLPTGDGSEGLALSPDGRELWVGARGAGELAVVDTLSGKVLERLALPGVPIRLAMTPDGRRVLVSCAGSSELVMYDRESRRELARAKVAVPLAPDAAQRPFAGLAPGSALPVGLAIALDGRSAYVAATMADKILRYDIERLDLLAVIEVAGEPDGMGLTSMQQKALCHGCDAPPSE
jgi:DNA-binding beta-propeller fold protein YncE